LSATTSAEPDWEALVTVGTVARAHGLAGQVVVAGHNADAADRFRPGVALHTQLLGAPRVLVVTRASPFQSRWLVAFDGVTDRDAADQLHGADLRVAVESLPALPDGAFYHHALVDCEVHTTSGQCIGRVSRVEGGSGQSVLVVAMGGHEVLIPLVEALCPVIDPEHGRIVVDPPEGLLELNR
jgi:16S rRNA processing protein RimM